MPGWSARRAPRASVASRGDFAAWRVLAVVAALGGGATAASAQIPRDSMLTIAGAARDEQGRPLTRTQIAVEGSYSAGADVDAAGRFTVRVPARALDDLVRAPLALWVRARRLEGRTPLANGEPALRLEVRGDFDSTGAEVIVVRSNDSLVTARLARAIRAGHGLADTIPVDFRAAAGKEAPRDLAMRAVEVVRRAAPPAEPAVAGATAEAPRRAPASRPAAAPSKRDASRTAGAAAASDDDRIVLAPRSALSPDRRASVVDEPAPAPVPDPRDSCLCRVQGTIEVRSEKPLSRRVRVELWLDGDPAATDTVELFMGSPREFELTARGCRKHRVLYVIHNGPRLRRLAPEDPTIVCDRSGLRQVRIVLAPSRGD